MYRGFAVYGDWNGGTFFGSTGDLYLIPIPEKTLINDYEFMKGIMEKAKVAHPKINWRLIDVQIEWRKA